MKRCFKCGEALDEDGPINHPDAWLMVNAAPHAASGGTMVPMHHRCWSMPLRYLTGDEQRVMQSALRASVKIINE